jgi:hypothetical protein
MEFRWDGNGKHFLFLDATAPHFWSSATLYDREMSFRRKQWFLQWIKREPFPRKEDIFNFHTGTGSADASVDLVINQNGQMLTVSICSIAIAPDCLDMQYFDMRSRQHYSSQLQPGKIYPVSI